MQWTRDHTLTGILLAAGKGTRFDPTGARSKLLQRLQNGDEVAIASAKNLLSVLPVVVAIVRPDAEELATRLRAAGCAVAACPDADRGMGRTLAFAVAQAASAPGWIIALADMPYVKPHTIHALADAIERGGAAIAAPVHRQRRGNPVAFGALHLDRLLRLDGDRGASKLIDLFPTVKIEVDDEGIHRDIDAPADLVRSDNRTKPI
jgi:molybdenum cofactor cytidylyltransferase